MTRAPLGQQEANTSGMLGCAMLLVVNAHCAPASGLMTSNAAAAARGGTTKSRFDETVFVLPLPLLLWLLLVLLPHAGLPEGAATLLSDEDQSALLPASCSSSSTNASASSSMAAKALT